MKIYFLLFRTGSGVDIKLIDKIIDTEFSKLSSKVTVRHAVFSHALLCLNVKELLLRLRSSNRLNLKYCFSSGSGSTLYKNCGSGSLWVSQCQRLVVPVQILKVRVQE